MENSRRQSKSLGIPGGTPKVEENINFSCGNINFSSRNIEFLKNVNNCGTKSYTFSLKTINLFVEFSF